MVNKWRKKPVVIEAMQIPDRYPDDMDPTEDGYARNLQAARVYGWVEQNTLGSFDCLPIIEGEPGATWPESGVSIDPRDGRMMIATLEGGHWVDPGDYVIRGVAGEFYPCKPDIFDQTYEFVEGDPTW